jgi:hypothetical protein
MRLGRRGLEQRIERLRQEEGAFDVEVHDLVPACFGELFERRTPSGACIVDEDIELRLALRQRRGQRLAAFDCRDVHRQRDAVGAQFGRGLLAGVGLARVDINFGACRDKALGHMATEILRSAGDKRDAAFKAEQFFQVHYLSPSFPLPLAGGVWGGERAQRALRLFRPSPGPSRKREGGLVTV